MAETVNQKVLAWARGRLRQQVGDGECWTLADRALGQAGASSSTTTGEDDDYVWGDPVALKDVQAGDILQFRDFTVTTRTDVDVTFADGSGSETWKERRARRGHHTAIVDAVRGAGVLRVLEQHVKPLGKKVQRHSVRSRSVSPVSKTAHKKMKHESGSMKTAKVVETKTITVSGQIWAYRPKKK